VVPDVELARRDVEVAGQDQRRRGIARGRQPGQPLIEVELVVELRVLASVGDVAPGGDVDV
jgi:hypothetical protein